ncbi:GNAT family N-acetyltransferase [Paenibacillus sp. NPDC057934]|uniref:GNAT family N-acetyltransferase n=1 Tax=Paenibacillus sp. NPDC057934 TaxID=3346282 RepID=UPI0036D878F9
MMVTLRVLHPGDAEELLNLQHRLDQESSFMLLEPDERRTTVDQLVDMLTSVAASDTSVLIGAEAEGSLVGYLSVRGGNVRRNSHSAYIVIGILQEYQGLGIGSGLFREVDTWAAENGIVRLELTVMTHNEKAVALYQKSGYSIEGTKLKSLKVDGQWVDEYYMSKLLSNDEN